MSPKDSLTDSIETQGRWAWRTLPLVALLTGLFLWRNAKTLDEVEWETRYHLLRKAPAWSLIHAFTGRTIGR